MSSIIVRRFCLLVLMCMSTTAFAGSRTWTGVTNADWTVSTNWSDNTVPLAIDDVIIPAAPANQPTISAGTAALANSVEVQNGATLTIEVMGSLTINGSSEHLATTAFYNNGTVTNNGRLIIGNTSGVGAIGLFNDAIFNNNSNGEIQIDRSSIYGLDNHNTTAIFTNSGKITIGGIASVGEFGLYTHGNFYNNLGGEINIDNSTNTGLTIVNGTNVLYNYAKITIGATAGVGSYGVQNFGNLRNETTGEIKIDNSSVTGLRSGDYRSNVLNKGKITVGSVMNVGTYGLANLGVFDNNTGGEIRIDRTIDVGLLNAGTFNNAARIILGGIASIGNFGLYNYATFHNNTGGEIKIDRSTSAGLVHSTGTFINAAKISIGPIAHIGPLGMQSSSDFTNDIGGEINIDNSTGGGLYVAYGTFTNKAKIIIGAVGQVGNTGISNEGFINNSGCSALINIISNSYVFNYQPFSFSNSGTVIENSNGDSDISYNTGVIQNLNGGKFIVGGNQPLNTTLTNTTCNLANGAVKITGLHPNTSYTLSYTVSGTTTAVSPNPISNANGEITVANLSAGNYTITLGGDCLPIILTLSASLSNSGPPSTQTVTENITSGSALIQAGAITATNQVFNASVEYKGSQSVILLPGFQAKGNYFKATIGPGCN